MTHSEDRDASADRVTRFVLGQLDAAEAAQLEAELRVNPELAQEVDALRAVVERLPHATATPPPPGLRERILEEASQRRDVAGQPRRGRPWMGAIATLAASIVALVLGVDSYQLRQEVALERELNRMLLEPNLVLSFELEGRSGFGKVSLDLDEQRGAIAVRSLPELAEDQVYRLWARVGDGDVFCGEFGVEEGRRTTQFAVPVSSYTEEIEKLFVTLETRGAERVPRGPVVMESV